MDRPTSLLRLRRAVAAGLVATGLVGYGPPGAAGAVAAHRAVHLATGAWTFTQIGSAHGFDEAGSSGPVAVADTARLFVATLPVDTAGVLVTAHESLAEIDLGDGSQQRGPRLADGTALFSVGRALGELAPAHDTAEQLPSGPWTVRFVTGRAMSHVTAAVTLAGPGASAPTVADSNPVLASAGLWLGGRQGLTEYDTHSGAGLRTVALGGPVDSLAFAPDGRRLYVSVDRLAADDLADPLAWLYELAPATGRILAWVGTFGIAGDQLSAIDGGVYASARSGNAGGVTLYRSAGRHVVRGSREAFAPVPRSGGTSMGGIGAFAAGPAVWLTSATGLACVDPGTGRYRAGSQWGSGQGSGSWVPAAWWRGRLYGLQSMADGHTALSALDPPGACGG